MGRENPLAPAYPQVTTPDSQDDQASRRKEAREGRRTSKNKAATQPLTPEAGQQEGEERFETLKGESERQTYERWFKSLSKEEQKSLEKKGLGVEHPEGKVDSNWVFEVQPDHEAYSTNDKSSQDFDEPPAPIRLYTEDDLLETVRRVVMAMQLSESPDVIFQARCILIAFGIGDPPTETELAKQKNCSRQFVSKKVKRIQQLFNLSPSQYMRSEAACKAYAKAWSRQQEKTKKTAEDTELPL